MRERGTKVRSVDRTMSSRFGRVNILASTAVEFDGLLVGDVGETDGEEGL